MLPFLFLLFQLTFAINPDTILPLPIYSYTAREYKAHPQILCVAFDSVSHRWFLGTGEEVLVFDGVDFEHVYVGAGKPVFSMDIGSGDTVWIGCLRDFGFIAPDMHGKLQFHSLLNKVPDSLLKFNIIWGTHFLGNTVFFNDAIQYLYIYYRPSDTFYVLRPFNNTRFYESSKVRDGIIIEDFQHGLYHISCTPPFKSNLVCGSRELGKLPVRKVVRVDNGYIVVTRRDGFFFIANKIAG